MKTIRILFSILWGIGIIVIIFKASILAGLAVVVALISFIVKVNNDTEKEMLKQRLNEQIEKEKESEIENMKLVDSEYGLFQKVICDLTELPDDVFSNLSFYLDSIDSVTISQVSIDTEQIHHGPVKMDGSPDWRFKWHRWKTEVWRTYNISAIGKKNISFHIRRQEGENISKIITPINHLNVLIKCLKNDESFKIPYQDLMENIKLLKQSRETALQYAKRLTELNEIVSKLEGIHNYLADSDISKLNKARAQVANLTHVLSQQTIKVKSLFNDMENDILRLKELFRSILPKYDLERIETQKTTALEKLNFLIGNDN